MAALDLGALPTGTLCPQRLLDLSPGGRVPRQSLLCSVYLPNTYYAPGTVEGTGREWAPKHLRSLFLWDFRSQCWGTVDVRMRAGVDEEKHV